MNKEQLLEELKKLQHPDGRKIRSDKGKSRESYTKRTKTPRTDKGVKRKFYTKEGPGYNKRLFEQFITMHTDNVSGTGDTLTRDNNMIFPPMQTKYYKLVTPKDRPSYRSSVKRRNHPEQLRWNWLMAEYKCAQTSWDKAHWETIIIDWYFICKEDLEQEMWTYNEWAWSYVNAIGGHPNRIKDHTQVILLYEAFAEGAYGQIEYDEKGEVIWFKK